ncbi:MAG: hypothetical protein ABI231_08075 [Candidatus Tumulicola sp.]
MLCAGALCLALAACQPKPIPIPPNLVVSAKEPRVRPAAPIALPKAAPRIVHIWMSTLTIEAGIWLNGTIVTSTNVASVEVRTAAFSINASHVGPGIFRFHTHVLELPPLSRRHTLELSIIARNTAGTELVEHAPLAIR